MNHEMQADQPNVEPQGNETIRWIADLQQMDIKGLQKFAKDELGLDDVASLPRPVLVYRVVKALSDRPGELLMGKGVLEILPDGFGFLRSPNYNYLSSPEDIYVSPQQCRRFDLRKGDTIEGPIRPPKEREKYFALSRVDKINNKTYEQTKDRVLFENLTPLYPKRRLHMETAKENYDTRILELTAPIGMGQRALIVAPPKSGKTIIMQKIAKAVEMNNPDIILMVLLIDERPEEVTDMIQTVNKARKSGEKTEVIASTFDEPPERHVIIAEMAVEKARRLVECGYDVVILLDNLTRLARAYNTVQPHSGKILTGGVDANALHKPKRFLGAARNTEEAGSLTIIATALIDTGSRMDEVIFEEFKGTGNMELVLDRRLAERRIFPAIDILKSGTRKEEIIVDPGELDIMRAFRQNIGNLQPEDAMKMMLKYIKKTSSNVEFLMQLKDLKDLKE
jgi:transcription termination factor Rho